ncbi:MAG TPA: hypothetical protein VFM18_23100 [Methanosarcina sp.]|nr:hypothetical protein [Methanosarcina sp.]
MNQAQMFVIGVLGAIAVASLTSMAINKRMVVYDSSEEAIKDLGFKKVSFNESYSCGKMRGWSAYSSYDGQTNEVVILRAEGCAP